MATDPTSSRQGRLREQQLLHWHTICYSVYPETGMSTFGKSTSTKSSEKSSLEGFESHLARNRSELPKRFGRPSSGVYKVVLTSLIMMIPFLVLSENFIGRTVDSRSNLVNRAVKLGHFRPCQQKVNIFGQQIQKSIQKVSHPQESGNRPIHRISVQFPLRTEIFILMRFRVECGLPPRTTKKGHFPPKTSERR